MKILRLKQLFFKESKHTKSHMKIDVYKLFGSFNLKRS